MARGNCIIVSSFPQGHFEGGFISGTPKPGTILQIDPTVALKSGRHTWVVYNRDADGDRPAGPFGVLCEDSLQGKTVDDAYVSGEFAPRIYMPVAGDELNLLFMNVAGTADDIAAGDIAIVDDGTGKVIKTTGTVETEVAVFLEAYVDPTADRLLWCKWSGQ
jgi:hypothetical protein